MAQEDLNKLGYHNLDSSGDAKASNVSIKSQQQLGQSEQERKRRGFVAGLRDVEQPRA